MVIYDLVESQGCQVTVTSDTISPEDKFIRLNFDMKNKPAKVVMKKK